MVLVETKAPFVSRAERISLFVAFVLAGLAPPRGTGYIYFILGVALSLVNIERYFMTGRNWLGSVGYQ